MYEDNIKWLKYDLKLPRSLDCFNGSPLSSTKNVHGRVPMLVTCLAPGNATISTTSLWSSSLPPSLDSDQGVDACRCVSWLLSAWGVEDGELNSSLAFVWPPTSRLCSVSIAPLLPTPGWTSSKYSFIKKEIIFPWDNVKVKEQSIIIEHMIALKK